MYRGRKYALATVFHACQTNLEETKNTHYHTTTLPNTYVMEDAKRRGRRPKGGKMCKVVETDPVPVTKPNIILHLRCSIHDVTLLGVDPMMSVSEVATTTTEPVATSVPTNTHDSLYHKVKSLSTQLHWNEVPHDHTSACFWCTCTFATPTIYLPMFVRNQTYHVYGCFCSPECACAYLMHEPTLDQSTRFERHHLLHRLYSDVYQYTQSIRPAPDPRYTLSKFAGTLTIDEYRTLHTLDKQLIFTAKPMCVIQPEVHVDNTDFSTQGQKIKSQSQLGFTSSGKRKLGVAGSMMVGSLVV